MVEYDRSQSRILLAKSVIAYRRWKVLTVMSRNPHKNTQKKPKKQPKKQASLVIPPQPSVIPTHVITNINRFTASAIAIPALLSMINFNRIFEEAENVYLESIAIFSVLLIFKIGLQRRIFNLLIPPWDTGIHSKFRRFVIFGFALNLFLIFVLSLPLLYVSSAWSKMNTLIFGNQEINKQVTIGLFYVFGALFSGVIGNLTYDILKYYFLRRLPKDKRK
jgi:hypothetical protein